ncbi:hypothetical protein ACTXMT_03340 [Psychrobacter faecalis]|uniref:hypothetical protein n=1 Tax=Psychrobacter faecalis TaxID=180588 RepID=UPI003FD40B3D
MAENLFFILLSISSVYVVFMLGVRLLKGESNGYFFVIPVFLLFYILPVIMDKAVGLQFMGPSYSLTSYAAMYDSFTSNFYNIYILFVLLFFYWQSRSKKIRKISIENEKYSIVRILAYIKRWRFLFWVVILIPIILILISGDLSLYSTYADRARTTASPLQSTATKMVVISTPLIAFLFIHYIYRINKLKDYLSLLPFFLLILLSGINIYIHGKRSIVATLLLLIVVSIFYTKVINRKRLLVALFLIIGLFYFFLGFYGKNINEANTLLEVYEGLRIDFSRDYSLKFVIFHELLNDEKILPYKGASYIFLLLFFIPRSLWLAKPHPYAVYFTNSIFGNFGGADLYGWGLTTSFVSEAVSNLGYLGLLFFPLFYSFFMLRIERIASFGTRMLGLLIMVLLLILHPIAVMVLILLFLLLITYQKIF